MSTWLEKCLFLPSHHELSARPQGGLGLISAGSINWPATPLHRLPFPVAAPVPNSQDIELTQLDSKALEESFQGKLGGRIAIVEHDTWKGRREKDLECVCQ